MTSCCLQYNVQLLYNRNSNSLVSIVLFKDQIQPGLKDKAKDTDYKHLDRHTQQEVKHHVKYRLYFWFHFTLSGLDMEHGIILCTTV